jgi:hypothetical protein
MMKTMLGFVAGAAASGASNSALINARVRFMDL